MKQIALIIAALLITGCQGVKAVKETPFIIQQQAFYWSGEQRNYLTDTGYALAVVKEGKRPPSQWLGRPDGEEGEWLSRIAEDNNLVILKHHEEHESIEYAMPVVRVDDGDPMVMLPQISIRFSKDIPERDVPFIASVFGLKIKRKQFRPADDNEDIIIGIQNGYILELKGEVNYAQLLLAAHELYLGGTSSGKVHYCHIDFIPMRRHAR